MAHPRGSAPSCQFLKPFALAFALALALALALAPVGGCVAFLSPPSVEMVGVELVSLGLTSGTVAVTLDLTNASSRKMEILGFLYEVEVRDSEGDAGWR
ncbi:MAG: hypothetical protein ABIF09_09600, partial [Gemmatimonadota bacterium]